MVRKVSDVVLIQQPSRMSAISSTLEVGELILYTYFRSYCSCRARTACALKRIPLTFRYVNLIKGEQVLAPYIDAVNPNGTVPTLVVNDASGKTVAKITQSIAILEFLEEAFPSTVPLLPPASDHFQRAKVRELVDIIACDVQPPTNLRILKTVNELGATNQVWFQGIMEKPLQAYEEVLVQTAGKYSVGDQITLADLCLAPAIENAVRWEVDMSKFPNVMRVFDAIRVLPEFVQGDWRHQEDTPEALRSGT
ncbi:Putative glutathione S-transferase, Thioredoxin-like superfamily, glutathione Transferase family [Septoria linicola]|uniref:Glutathione S-transferase, Thioredoxin-like superfamily, glutathione Transferase family n=1 Tax=Septoria linicola TaxID=215465 RepID=A0A9Q9AQY2_9PEZI|nr:putative glutathione S-transferase, Thioredoxin-like superfamily, glutathione Transferase family [Septoria linicola]USW52884.1 Putative glutathione S-transferase, Thioredoxin-like superfamily, glutathione Transferase family [Septoria linicola]